MFAIVVLSSAAPAVYSGAAPENAGQILARLNKLPSEQRQKQLVEKAKAEGEVSFYSSLQAQQIEPFIRVFQKRYPFIKVNPYRVSGNRQVIKIQTEMNGGNHLFDVTNGSSEQARRSRRSAPSTRFRRSARSTIRRIETRSSSLLYVITRPQLSQWSSARTYPELQDRSSRNGKATCF
jgi:hypothetical protein